MRHCLVYVRAAAIGIAVLGGPAHALLIVPAFDLNPGSDPNSFNNATNPAGEMAAIETAIATIDGLYNNPGTVRVLFNFSDGVTGQSTDGGSFASYGQYTAQHAGMSAANPGNMVLATAVANLSQGNTGSFVLGTTALLRVGLGFTGSGTTPCFNASGTYVSGCNATYDGIIMIGNLSTSSSPGQNSRAVAVAEHELNEVLGSGGTGSTIGENFSASVTGVVLGPTDLYRYHSATSTCSGVTVTPSYTTSNSEVACYSIDGGKTWLEQMNQAGGGSDYGDFATAPVADIQDAFYGGSSPVYSLSSPETIMLESVGWEVPEPASFALFAGALTVLGGLRCRPAIPG